MGGAGSRPARKRARREALMSCPSSRRGFPGAGGITDFRSEIAIGHVSGPFLAAGFLLETNGRRKSHRSLLAGKDSHVFAGELFVAVDGRFAPRNWRRPADRHAGPTAYEHPIQ